MNRKALVILALFGLASVPASAICVDAPTFGSVVGPCPSTVDGLCAFVTPVPDHGPYNLTGYWWNMLTGIPTIGSGNDNGSWAITGDMDAGDWMFDLGGGRMVPFGTWGQTDKIDGCYSTQAGFAESVNIMAVFDQDGAVGYHAAVGVMRTPWWADEWDYSLSEGGAHDGMDKPLMPIPRPQILSWSKDDALTTTTLTLAGLTADIPGVYHDSNLTNSHIVKGVKLYVVSGDAPVDRTRTLWGTAVATYLFDGINESLTLACPGTYNLAYSVMYDSSFESPIVGPHTQVVACGDALAEPGEGKKFRLLKNK